MIDLHPQFVAAAYIIFGMALLWDYLAPRFNYRKTLRTIRLRARRQTK